MIENYKHRPEIDGLRAIAVIAVIVNHFREQFLPGGFLGVDIFFVISGYVITGSLLSHQNQNFFEYVGAFYARRIRRLLPALLVVLYAGVIGVSFLATWQYISISIRTGLASLFGASNIYLLYQAIDYWGTQAGLNIFTHTWSLGVEEQFYLFYPVLMWLMCLKYSRLNKRASFICIFILGSIATLSLSLYLSLFKESPALIFYGTPFRIWEILFGAVSYFYVAQQFKESKPIPQNIASNKNVNKATLVSNCITYPTPLALLFLLFADEKYISIEIRTVLCVLATTLCIIFIDKNQFLMRMFTGKLILYVGSISYSLYLWHWPVLVLGRWVGFQTYKVVITQLIVIIIISIFSYEFIEKPIRYSVKHFSIKKTITLAFLFIFSTIVIFGGLAVLLKKNNQKNGEEVKMIHSDYPCHSPKWTKDPINDCLTPKKLNLKQIYVMGDSHSTNLLPSIENAMSNSYELLYLGDSELTSSLLSRATAKTIEQCKDLDCSDNEFQKRLTFINSKIQSGDILIFSMARDSFYNTDFENGVSRKVTNPEVANLVEKMIIAGKLVRKRGGRLFLINDIPKVCSHKQYEINKITSPRNPCIGSEKESLIDRKPLTEAYEEISSKSGAIILDPHSYLCPDNMCSSSLDGRLIYFDGSPHFITAYPDPLKKFFKAQLFDKY